MLSRRCIDPAQWVGPHVSDDLLEHLRESLPNASHAWLAFPGSFSATTYKVQGL